jgi:hypothetical protein
MRSTNFKITKLNYSLNKQTYIIKQTNCYKETFHVKYILQI